MTTKIKQKAKTTCFRINNGGNDEKYNYMNTVRIKG